MTNLYSGPKIRDLTTKESINSLESWRQNVLYGLRLNGEFRPYLQDNFNFGKKSRAKPCRNLVDDVEEDKDSDGKVTTRIVKSKEEKAEVVDLLLDQVANYASNIPRNDITRDSGSIAEVWQKIRQYFNIQQAGSLLNDVWNVKRNPEETPQALFGRMKQMYDENLLTTDGLYHVDGCVDEDEELSPTLHNSIILHWLQVLHPDLRDLVTGRFITQLRQNTYATIFPEISKSVDSLLEELNNGASACRTYSASKPTYNQYRSQYQSTQVRDRPNYQYSNTRKKTCEFCKATGRKKYYTHTIEQCMFIKKINSDSAALAQKVDEEEGDDIEEHFAEFYQSREESNCQIEHVLNRVSIDASPVISFEVNGEECNATLDTGATCSVLKEKKAVALKAKIRPTNQRVRMADGESSLTVVGETDIVLYRNNKPFPLSAVVCRNTDTDLLAGMPFLKSNDVAIHPFCDEVVLNGTVHIKYDPIRKPKGAINRVTVHSDAHQVIWPGQSAEFKVPGVSGDVAVEPRWDTHHNRNIKESAMWPTPQVVPVVNGQISLHNSTTEPVTVRRSEQICNVHPEVNIEPVTQPDSYVNKAVLAKSLPPVLKKSNYSSEVKLNPDKVMSKAEETSFSQLLATYDEVFNPTISRYNGKSGSCYVKVNLGPNLPVQRKGRLPFYGKKNLVELQDKFDELVEKGVLARPQDIDVTVENINHSFLVNKPPPSTDKRLVTDFASIAKYCRPTPSLMPSVDSTLNTIGGWSHVIKADATTSYHQLDMDKASMKYCGVHTPFKGLLVYTVGAMGLPGVEVALEELMCLLFGEMVKQGKVAKLADDIFIGGNSIEELRENFHRVLQILLENNIKLSAKKTVIVPKTVTILGWVWSEGKLSASPHKLSTLAACKKPVTVTALKAYLGTYRFLARVLKDHARVLAPLEDAIKGKNARDKVDWTEELSDAFKKSQDALPGAKTITMPRSTDQLCIVTDASIRPGAVGATLFAVREGRRHLAGYYNSKLPEFQQRWLPCEVEGLAIAAALNHYAPLIIQSEKKPQIFTDSLPCVQAVQKLNRGEFSVSARLSSFLSNVSRYQAEVSYIPGTSNLSADFASRNPLECKAADCSVCKFISQTMDSVVLAISVEEVIEGRVRIPFTNRNTWKSVQENCPDLRKVKEFRLRGTTPSKKSKNLRCVRRYLSAGTLAAYDGLLVHPLATPIGPVSERIVVPSNILHGLLTVLHLRLNHPTAYQMSKVFGRFFFALNSEKAIAEVTRGCAQCAALREVPRAMIEESTDPPPATVGVKFAADIIKRCSQNIFLIRESVTSYTLTEIITDEKKETVADVLLKKCNLLRPSSSSKVVIRLDPASAHQALFKSLESNSLLFQNNISLELGRVLNKNKNPVGEKGIRELVRELQILNPEGGPVSSAQLSKATANLNSRYRASGLSSHEMWTQRDQVTGEQLPIVDRELIESQHRSRIANHPHSQKSKAFGKPCHPIPDIDVGSLVYVYSDRDKVVARKRYLVVKRDGDKLKLRKFTAQLFGTKEYDAKLKEVYKVPSMDFTDLPHTEDARVSDDDEAGYNPNHKSSNQPIILQDSLHQDSQSEEETDASQSVTEHSDSDVEDQEEESDPTFEPPRDLAPAVMERPQRLRSEPTRYGEWTK